MNHNYSQLTDLCGCIRLKISHIFLRSLDSSWHFDKHCHSYNRIYFILDGHGYLFNDTERVDLLPGNVYIIPAGSSYNYRCDDYLEKIFAHFTLSLIPGKDLLSAVKRIAVISPPDGEIEKIKEICSAQTASSAMFLEGYILRAAADMTAPYSDIVKKDLAIYKKYSRMFQYIENNLYADTRVSDICRYIGFSQTYIGHMFKTDTGKTIKEFFTKALLEKAKNMLQLEPTSIKLIAAELHFNNEFYFSRFFKRHMGISPREYRLLHPIDDE